MNKFMLTLRKLKPKTYLTLRLELQMISRNLKEKIFFDLLQDFDWQRKKDISI